MLINHTYIDFGIIMQKYSFLLVNNWIFFILSFFYAWNLLNLHLNLIFIIMGNLNRLKAVLADAGQTNKWLAEQLGKDPVTISKWCTNTTQPDLQTLSRISELLQIDIRELLVSRNQSVQPLKREIK